MRRKNPRCLAMEPDCFNCPFDECIATMKDINRQEGYKSRKDYQYKLMARNKQIQELYNSGVTIDALAETFSLSPTSIRTIVRSLHS